ncbi:MAG: hypothetical protein JNL82_22305 [Myxococcales bacterium]|nr:hypothetical protein [Myxococcales bacterium]
MLLFVCVAGTGCDESADVGFSEDSAAEGVAPRNQVHNAPVINTANLNGWTLNGWTLNGETFNGWTLNGWTLNGWTLNSMSLNGTEFQASRVGSSQPVSGTDMIGAQLTLSQGYSVYVLTLEDIYLDEQNPAGDVYLYDISVFDVFAGETVPLCTIDGVGVPAIPLSNYWNPTTGARIDNPNVVTFACRGGALAKCVDWGYLPWSTASRCEGETCEVVSLADHHQACTRMVRADYCGDGTPHTHNGTPIDIYDGLSPQIQAASTGNQVGWGVEAEWGPDGARCIGEDLRLSMFAGENLPEPACLAALEDIEGCGDLAASRGASVANRYCDEWITDPSACGM